MPMSRAALASRASAVMSSASRSSADARYAASCAVRSYALASRISEEEKKVLGSDRQVGRARPLARHRPPRRRCGQRAVPRAARSQFPTGTAPARARCLRRPGGPTHPKRPRRTRPQGTTLPPPTGRERDSMAVSLVCDVADASVAGPRGLSRIALCDSRPQRADALDGFRSGQRFHGTQLGDGVSAP